MNTLVVIYIYFNYYFYELLGRILLQSLSICFMKVQGKSEGQWSNTVCFVLIQTYFAFSCFTTLPEFEGVCVRHVVVLALAVVPDLWLHSSISP